MAVASAYCSMEGVNAIVEALSADAFCTNPEVGLDEGQTAVCAEVIAQFMPYALQALGGSVTEEGVAEACSNLYDGICSI